MPQNHQSFLTRLRVPRQCLVEPHLSRLCVGSPAAQLMFDAKSMQRQKLQTFCSLVGTLLTLPWSTSWGSWSLLIYIMMFTCELMFILQKKTSKYWACWLHLTARLAGHTTPGGRIIAEAAGTNTGLDADLVVQLENRARLPVKPSLASMV